MGTKEVKSLNQKGVKKYETIGNAILFLWKNGCREIN
ncbi:hypothetical protein SAMN05444673_2841 [Bacillus sp. OV166]|nr:hypothetical protein SAMN05444673_2841 [Bacillus sp. OV166]